MGATERSDELARAMEALGSPPLLAGCRCASPVAGLTPAPKVGTPGVTGAASQVGLGIGAAIYSRHRERQAHGLPGWLILGVGAETVDLWTEASGAIAPGELLYRWHRADVSATVSKQGLIFAHLTLAAPDLAPTVLRATTRGPKGYGSHAVDLLTGAR